MISKPNKKAANANVILNNLYPTTHRTNPNIIKTPDMT